MSYFEDQEYQQLSMQMVILLMVLLMSGLALANTVDCNFEEDNCTWSSHQKVVAGQWAILCGLYRAGYYVPSSSCQNEYFFRNHVPWQRKKMNITSYGVWSLQSEYNPNTILQYITQVSDFISPEIPASNGVRCLRYRYNVKGQVILVVVITKDIVSDLHGVTTLAVHFSGYTYDNGGYNLPNRGFVLLPPYKSFKIIIRAIYQFGYYGGSVVIDDIRLSQGRCLDTCSEDQYKCNDDFCISASKVCDSRKDCQDGSDERDCGISGNFDIVLNSCEPSRSIHLVQDCKAPRPSSPIKTSNIENRYCYSIVSPDNSTCTNVSENCTHRSQCYYICPDSCSCDELIFKCSTPHVPEVARVVDISGVIVPRGEFQIDNFKFLVTLKLVNCGLSIFPINTTLAKLQHVDLSNNNIKFIDPIRLNHLLVFKMNNNPQITVELFESMKNLRILQFQNTSVRLSVIDFKSYRFNADLSYNNLSGTEIKSNSLHSILHFRNCQISNLENSNIDCHTLDLRNNNLKSYLVSRKTSRLWLQNNNLLEFVKLRQYWLSQALQEVDLENNTISKVEKQQMEYFPYLIYINLSGNKIREIGAETFSYQSELIYLDISYNMIKHISKKAFIGLNSLQYLFLQGNMINQLESFMFTDLGLLQDLDLSNNSIKVIKENSFHGLSRLKYLSLQLNAFRVRKSLFYGLSLLNILKVDDYTLCCARPPTVSKERCIAPSNYISSCDQLIDVPVLGVCIWYMALLAVFGNISVIIYRVLNWKNISGIVQTIFTINLSFADFLMGVYLYIIAISNIYYSGQYGINDYEWRHSKECTLAGILATLSSESSAIFVLLISIDRVIAIKFGLKSTKISRLQCKILCCMTWIVALVIACVPAFEKTYFKAFYSSSGICISLPLSTTKKPGWEFSFALFIGFNLILFLGILICQIIIFAAVVESRRYVDRTVTSKREMSVAKTLFAVVFTDMLCWIPIGIIGLMTLFGVDITSQIYFWIIVVVLPLNSALNPLLYTFVVVLRGKSSEKRNTKKSSTMAKSSVQMTDISTENRHSTMKQRMLRPFKDQPRKRQITEMHHI